MSFLFLYESKKRKGRYRITTIRMTTTGNYNYSKKLLLSVTSKNLQTSCTKKSWLNFMCMFLIYNQLLWSGRTWGINDNQICSVRERRNRINLSAERSMAIIHIMVLSFLVAHIIMHHPETKWHIMWRLRNEVTLVAVWLFSSWNRFWQCFTQGKKKIQHEEKNRNQFAYLNMQKLSNKYI